MKKLYRLKSNRNTIVERDGDFHKVFWAHDMQYGYDARWMRHRWNPDNVEELTKEETKHFYTLQKAFIEQKSAYEKQELNRRRPRR
jgi:hypothetical protein